MTWFHWFMIVVTVVFMACIFFSLFCHARAENLQQGKIQEEYPGETRSFHEGSIDILYVAVFLLIIMFVVGVGHEAVPKLMGG